MTSRFIVFILFAASSSLYAQRNLQIADATCEYQDNPVGIDTSIPRFSWKLKSDLRGVMQKSYEIRVSSDPTALVKGHGIVWTTGVVNSDQSQYIAYGGPELKTGQRYHWQVQVTAQLGNKSGWSTPKYWEMGLLSPSDWKATWIDTTIPGDSAGQPAPMLRRSFDLKKAVKRARLYITAHGIYDRISITNA